MSKSFKRVRGRWPLQKSAERGRKLLREALRESARGHKRKRNAIVSGWSGKPYFVRQYYVKRGQAKLIIMIRGGKKNRNKWHWMDMGTRRRTIYAKTRGGKRGMLRFRKGYRPATSAGRFSSSPYQRFGAWASKPSVTRGTEARHLNASVNTYETEALAPRIIEAFDAYFD